MIFSTPYADKVYFFVISESSLPCKFDCNLYLKEGRYFYEKIKIKTPRHGAEYCDIYGNVQWKYHQMVRSSTGKKDWDPTYYNGNVGFRITATHKLAQDKPTVTIMLPIDSILNDYDEMKEGILMKRLKYYLLNMQNDTSTYKEMYDGETILSLSPDRELEILYDPIYWHEDKSCEITSTHKLAQSKPTVTWNIPIEKIGIEDITTAAADYCLRAFAPYIDELNAELYNRSRPDDESGKYYLYKPGGEVLVRNTAYFALCPQKDYENGSGNMVYMLNDGVSRPPKMCLCIRMQVQLPKRKIRKTIGMLCKDLPEAVDRFIAQFDIVKFNETIALSEKQTAIRTWLKDSPYCSFITNGSILPRSKGTDLPMPNAVPFQSTPDDEIEICGVRGMGIKRGVTVITGGGYSGKSTLLDAISAGIYNHILGDGRELCITDDSAMTISAEDGRSVKTVNISPFIKWLPGGDTRIFSTEHASGSTSQAANIMEAVDCGARLLLIDEDRSATNFMIRDRMMKELIEKEPITPFTDRVKELYSACGVSTVLVIGGSGEYLSVADRVYMMDDFHIHDVTDKGRAICKKANVCPELPPPTDWKQARTLCGEGFSSYPSGSGSEKLVVSDMGFILIGDEQINIRGLHDIITKRQLDALGYMLRWLMLRNTEPTVDLDSIIDKLYEEIEKEGLDTVFSSYFTTTERFLDLPRKYELKAVINRMRKLSFGG